MNAQVLPDSALHDLLAELGRTSAADQDAIFRALPVDQARRLKGHLAAAAAPSAAFESAVQTQAAQAARSEACAGVSRIDLEAVPVGVAATLLAGVPASERGVLLKGLPDERSARLEALLEALPEQALARSSAQLRALLQDGTLARGPAPEVLRPATAPSTRPTPWLNTLTNWIRSWQRV